MGPPARRVPHVTPLVPARIKREVLTEEPPYAPFGYYCGSAADDCYADTHMKEWSGAGKPGSVPLRP